MDKKQICSKFAREICTILQIEMPAIRFVSIDRLRTDTHIEKIRIMNDVIVFMFGCMTLVCEIRVGSFLFFEMNVLLLLLGTAEICLACFMYYQEFMLPEVKACREREAKRRAERLMRQAERDVRKEWALYDK